MKILSGDQSGVDRAALDAASRSAGGQAIPGVRTSIMLDGMPMAAEHPSPRLRAHDRNFARIAEA